MTTSPLSYGPFISREQAQKQELKQYFTGKPCPKGHIAARSVSNCSCCECGRVRALARSRRLLSTERGRAANNARTKENYANGYYATLQQRAKKAQYIRARRKSDPNFKVLDALRHRLYLELGPGRNQATKSIAGCSIQDLRLHLEQQFLPGMTWANYGEWEIDHIRPCAAFADKADPALWHFSNLQPLWKLENRSKGAKLPA